jgi:hypothetical protein
MLVGLRGKEVVVRLRREVVGRILAVDHIQAADRMEVVVHRQVVDRMLAAGRSLVEEGIAGVEEDYRSNLVEEDIGVDLGRRKVEEGIVPGYRRSNRCQT